MNSRELAFLALSNYENELIDDALKVHKKDLSREDYALAREIASGTVKRLLSLQFIAKRVEKKLKLRKKEMRLLLTALYQHFFMDKIPLYAIVNETTEIAKNNFGKIKANFFNAYLRKLDGFTYKLPHKKNAFDMSIKYSYPPYFIKRLIEEYGMQKTIKILDIQNKIYPPMLRARKKLEKEKGIERVSKDIYRIKDKSIMQRLSERDDIYIQNGTPNLLMKELASSIKKTPKKILDLCASPGGKLILAHDLFPKAKLFANDVSEDKLSRLRENLEKYQIEAELSENRAEEYKSDEKFDLIILDVPCSNSGVFHKRAEARWRFTPHALEELSDLQAGILENAVTLLNEGGEIWYMTCSITLEENEDTYPFAADLGLKKKSEHKILPDEKGFDGGYALSLIL